MVFFNQNKPTTNNKYNLQYIVVHKNKPTRTIFNKHINNMLKKTIYKTPIKISTVLDIVLCVLMI